MQLCKLFSLKAESGFDEKNSFLIIKALTPLIKFLMLYTKALWTSVYSEFFSRHELRPTIVGSPDIPKQSLVEFQVVLVYTKVLWTSV